ncbi:hypothetical protein FDP41_009320 [Naegleria fowleri]|uniref:Uncharacterized protein n=1 Tax=Naegleria fowleri TaxID=5763 RepID=A0A6A5B2F4_NAEFO|nr:uncharacterized protein FDP41_009320 [Naegleria fowleri]KAF0972417.1 hypothetical protein FDP41_009320 [Naegleria fowleri]CAG4709868.1 unnamed protein product [Naegleria fowleri]
MCPMHQYEDDEASDITSSTTTTTYSRMTKSTSLFEISGSSLTTPSSIYHNHKYPSYMQNLPVCKSLQKAEEVKKLKHLVYQRDKATDRIKADRNELLDIKTCLNAFISLNQKVANLTAFIEKNEMKALYQIIKTDRDDLRKQVKELESKKSGLEDEIEKLNEQLTQLDLEVQKFHTSIEENFKANYSIDNIHDRFLQIDKDETNEAYNIPCTHPTLLRGMLHIFTRFLAFESVVIMDQNSRTDVISIDRIQQMSKSHSLLHDCGIILHIKAKTKQTASIEKIEFSEFKSPEERDKAFDMIFGLAFNAKE